MDWVVAREYPNPSEELAPAQATSSSWIQGSSTSRRSYLAKAFWELRLVEEYEAYKAAASEKRGYEIWLGWTPKERRWVLLACGPQSRFRLEQNRWKAELRGARFRRIDFEESDLPLQALGGSQGPRRAPAAFGVNTE